jgi:hypothetical protein
LYDQGAADGSLFETFWEVNGVLEGMGRTGESAETGGAVEGMVLRRDRDAPRASN